MAAGHDTEDPEAGHGQVAAWRRSPRATRVIAMELSWAGELGVAAGCAIAAVVIRFALDRWLGQQHVYTIAFAVTAIAALVAGWRAGVACAVLAQLSSNVLFVEPRGRVSWSGEDIAQTVTFYLMVVVLLCVTHLAVQGHRALGLLVLRLRHADEAKTDLLASIAHELRNPVSAMQLAVARMEMGEQGESRQKPLAVIQRQLTHITRLVEDLTDASRIHTGKVSLRIERHDVAGLLARAAELVEPALDQRRQCLQMDGGMGAVVKVDGARIVQVFANVLHNASKYSPDGTDIRVTVDTQGRDVCIEVIDEGAGIPNEKLEWVFDCYAQVKAGSDGFGLGLSLVRRLLELHGGTIKALSRGEERGATFQVLLPLAEPE
jgi:K+-sensing histidine kinase KdpD